MSEASEARLDGQSAEANHGAKPPRLRRATAAARRWLTSPSARQWALLVVLVAPMLTWKLDFNAHTFHASWDGSYYTNIARHVRNGDGLVSSVSLYHRGFRELPDVAPTYPLWPLVYGHTAKLFPEEDIIDVGIGLATFLYAVMLVFAFLWGRRLFVEPPFERFPAFTAGHVVVLVFGLHAELFEYTSLPYTEGLAYALLMIALWRFTRLFPEGGWRAGLEIGLWLGLLELARSQLIVVAIAAFGALAWTAAAGRDRRQAASLGGAALSFGAILVAYGLHLSRFAHDFGPMAFVTASKLYASDDLSPVRRLVETSGAWDYIRDRASGFEVAYSWRHKLSFRKTFYTFQYAVPLVLPFALLAGARLLREHGPRDVWRRMTAGRTSLWWTVWLVAIGAYAMFHLIHKDFMVEWNFARRQAAVCGLLFALCIVWLLRSRYATAVALGLVVLCAGAVDGYAKLASMTRKVEDRKESPYRPKLIEWLDRRAERNGGEVTVAAAGGFAQALSAYTTGVRYHWVWKKTTWRDIETLFGPEYGASYLLTPPHRLRRWKIHEDVGKFRRHFRRVARRGGVVIYRWVPDGGER